MFISHIHYKHFDEYYAYCHCTVCLAFQKLLTACYNNDGVHKQQVFYALRVAQRILLNKCQNNKNISSVCMYKLLSFYVRMQSFTS